MSKSNAHAADLLRSYAAALSLEGANRFKLKAYRRAAETIEGLEDDIAELVKRGSDLTELPGIGKAISEIIVEIVRSKKLTRLERTLAHLTPELVELATRPGLDPKKINRVYKKLGISSLGELKKSLEAGSIAEVFGPRIEYHVRQGLDERPRSLLYSVQDLAWKIELYLQSIPSVTKASVAGSLRRKQDTVGNLNFLVAAKGAKGAASVFERFRNFSGVLSADTRGPAQGMFKLSSGLSVALRWTAPEEWGLSLILATGSALHVQELEARAARRKIRLTSTDLVAKGIDIADEKSVYAGLGLAFVEPELREGRGEVAAASRRKLPKLIELGDLRGDLHMHTTASDGANSIAEMAAAAQLKGYEYIAITDHSRSLKIANGLSEKQLLQQIRNIDKVNARLRGFRILKSAEVDILADGKLDYSNAVLKELDCTICSIHSRFGLNMAEQTDRILQAMDNRYFTILGHATGRLMLKRQGYQLDMERIIKRAQANGCFFEINSSPDRLDLSDEHARLARKQGVKIAVNTDAHGIDELDFASAGINQARRAWLEASDVLNTLPLQQALRLFRR